MNTRSVVQSAVGISLSLDKLVQALQDEQEFETDNLCNFDVVVCSLGARPMIKEKGKVSVI